MTACALLHLWRTGRPDETPGFCRAATLEEVREHKYALTPGRYVGSADAEEDDEPFEEKFPRLAETLEKQFEESARLERAIRENPKGLRDGH